MRRQVWDKALDLALGRWRRHQPGAPVVGRLQWTVPRYDVTAFADRIDLDPLDTIESAPVWMTRAERLLLYTLAFCLRPQRYLEIGTYQGGSALVVSSALQSLGSDGRIYCVEPRPAIAPEHWRLLEARTTLMAGYSPAILPEAVRLAGGRFDLVLVDGDHTYEGVLADAGGLLPCVQPGGYVLFHDSFHPNVARAVDEFVEAHPNEVVDLGLLTREVTSQVDDTGHRVEWGGLRLVYVV